MSTIRVIGREDIQKVFTVTAALRAVESAYTGKSAGTGRVWPMVFHEFDPGHADLDIKSGDLESAGVYGLKVVSWYDSNAERRSRRFSARRSSLILPPVSQRRF